MISEDLLITIYYLLITKEMKIICIGRNYADHISELNNERPDRTCYFLKADSVHFIKEISICDS